MAGVDISDFVLEDSGSISWKENGVQQPAVETLHFTKENNDYISFVNGDYWFVAISTYNIPNSTITFISPLLEINGDVDNSSSLFFIGNTTFGNSSSITNRAARSYKASMSFSGNTILNTNVRGSNPPSVNPPIPPIITFQNGYLNVDNTTWINSNQDLVFGSNAQLQITSSSNGKTLIKANEVSGTITLDVQSGVNEGDTFSIEATTNNLFITDGEWTATPSTVGNVTTYTLAKAGPIKKQRLFYTYENGSKKLRFLIDSDGKQRLLGSL